MHVMCGWVSACVDGCVHVWMGVCMCGWVCACDVWMGECMCGWVCACVDGCVHVYLHLQKNQGYKVFILFLN